MIQKKRSLKKKTELRKHSFKKYRLLKGGRKIKIIIRTIDNTVEYDAEFNNSDNVLTIKNNIHAELGIDIEDQRITNLDIELDNNQILSDCGIVSGSTLVVEDTYEHNILTIKLAFIVESDQPGNFFIVRVHKDSTVLELKQKAAPMFKINVSDIQLSLDKVSRFDDDQILSDLELVTNVSVIYVDDTS